MILIVFGGRLPFPLLFFTYFTFTFVFVQRKLAASHAIIPCSSAFFKILRMRTKSSCSNSILYFIILPSRLLYIK